MPERTRYTLEQLRARAAQRITKYKTATNTDLDAAKEAIAHLLRDVFKYRDRQTTPPGEDESATVATLRREIDDLEEQLDKVASGAPVVPAGGVILTPDEKKKWDAFLALKLEPEKVAERLGVAETLEKERADAERTKSLGEMAEAAGFKNPDVFADLIKSKGWHVEMRKVTRKKRDEAGNETKENETVELPHIRPANDEKAALVLASEFIGQHAKFYVPALMAAPDGEEDGDDTGSDAGGNGGTSGASSLRLPIEPGGGKTPKPAGDPGAYIGRTYMTPGQRRSEAQKS